MYLVIEIQNNNGQVAHLVTVHETLNEAKSKFHFVLAAAAVSELTCHSAVILSDEGITIKSESYRHDHDTLEGEA